jgi:hypothetical protein
MLCDVGLNRYQSVSICQVLETKYERTLMCLVPQLAQCPRSSSLMVLRFYGTSFNGRSIRRTLLGSSPFKSQFPVRVVEPTGLQSI